MLGDQIGESSGKITGQRVLPGDDYRYIKMEITFEEQGTILGVPGMVMGTYTVFERVPGQLYGEGQGMIFTQDGEGAIWNAHGVGRMIGQGMSASYRYSLTVQAPPEGKLSRLNNVLVIGEHETDAENNTRSKIWEWK
jgi:hypothetical protein